MRKDNIKRNKNKTCTLFGLRTSNLALLPIGVVANGPASKTIFSTVRFSESIICDISSTVTKGSVPFDNNGNKPAKHVYLLHTQNSNSPCTWLFSWVLEEETWELLWAKKQNKKTKTKTNLFVSWYISNINCCYTSTTSQI